MATDIAARGIDVDGISHVVNFDLPDVPETYVRRIAPRRAGADGIAISLCDTDEIACAVSGDAECQPAGRQRQTTLQRRSNLALIRAKERCVQYE